MKLKIITVLLLAGMFFALSCVSDFNSAGRNKQAGRTSAAGAEASPGWEEVRTENLEDPRNNPAYGERMVNQYGKMVRLVPGTGTVTKDGCGAQIDYQGKQWWVEENFVGTYMMTEQDRSDSKGLNPVPEVSLVVSEDGTVLFTEDGEQRSGCLLQTRCYLEDIPLGGFDEIGGLLVSPCYQDNYGRIRLYRKMRPHPEPQFPSLSVYLTKQ